MAGSERAATARVTYFSRRLNKEWNLPSDRSAVMGIVNVTPDSFSDGGLYLSPEAIWQRVQTAIVQGADLLDFGAESTRPGALPVSDQEQLLRLAPVFELLPDVPVPVSIDTRSASVAAKALAQGFEIVNDVSGGSADLYMPTVVAEHQAVVIVVHARGTPENMDCLTNYSNVTTEVYAEWQMAAEKFYAAGLEDVYVWFDPGLGFAKSKEQCWQLLRDLARGRGPSAPLVLGISRKRFVDMMQLPPRERDGASNAAVALVANCRQAIFRVHDVSGAAQAVRTAKYFAQGVQG